MKEVSTSPPEWTDNAISDYDRYVYAPLEMILSNPVSVIESMAQSLSDTYETKGETYMASYVITDYVIGKAIGEVTKIDGSNTKGKNGSKNVEGVSGKVIETSYGRSSGKYKSTADFLTNIENRNGKFYIDKVTIDKIGQIEARGEDFSLLN